MTMYLEAVDCDRSYLAAAFCRRTDNQLETGRIYAPEEIGFHDGFNNGTPPAQIRAVWYDQL